MVGWRFAAAATATATATATAAAAAAAAAAAEAAVEGGYSGDEGRCAAAAEIARMGGNEWGRAKTEDFPLLGRIAGLAGGVGGGGYP